MCAVPFARLDQLLLAYAEHEPAAADAEIDRLATSYPSQRTAALRARIALVARAAKCEADLTQLAFIVDRLPEAQSGLLSAAPRIRSDVSQISRLQIRLNTVDRPFLREPVAGMLCREIESFRQRVIGAAEPFASEFRAAADQWLRIAERQLSEARAVLEKEPTVQVFRAGDPVDRTQEAFVLRHSVIGELERQLTLATGCPGLIVYGRRRTGKTTLLRNVSGFLPGSVRVSWLSMQHPDAFTSVESFVGLLARQIMEAMAGISEPQPVPHSRLPTSAE
jgi:hypothetical protein